MKENGILGQACLTFLTREQDWYRVFLSEARIK